MKGRRKGQRWRRYAPEPFDHGEPLKSVSRIPFAVVPIALIAIMLPFQGAQTHAITLDLPFPDFAPVVWETPPARNTITIDAQDQIRWNGNVKRESELATKLAQSRQITPQPFLLFKPDGEAGYETTARALNLVASFGLLDNKFCLLGLDQHRNFDKDTSGANPTRTVPADYALRLNLSIFLEEEPVERSQMTIIPYFPPSERECEALAELP